MPFRIRRTALIPNGEERAPNEAFHRSRSVDGGRRSKTACCAAFKTESSVPRRSVRDFRYRSEFEEHDRGCGPIAEFTAKRVQFEEAEALVVVDGLFLGIDEYTDAAIVLGHLVGENEDGAKELCANAGAVKILVGRKPGEPEHGQRVLREALSLRDRQVLNLDLRGRNGREADDEVVFIDGHVGGAKVVPELVLTSEAEKETIEVDLSRAKPASVIGRPKAPN